MLGPEDSRAPAMKTILNELDELKSLDCENLVALPRLMVSIKLDSFVLLGHRNTVDLRILTPRGGLTSLRVFKLEKSTKIPLICCINKRRRFIFIFEIEILEKHCRGSDIFDEHRSVQ